MDQEKGNPWKQSADAKKHPYDSPLTTEGHNTSSEVTAWGVPKLQRKRSYSASEVTAQKHQKLLETALYTLPTT